MRIPLLRLAIIAAIFLALHVLPLFWRPSAMWGVDFLFYLPTPVQGIFVLIAVLMFVPGFRLRIRSCACKLPLALWGEGRRVWLTRGLLILLAVGGFIALRSSRHFLGDGYYLLNELVSHTWQESNRAPLSFALVRTLHYAGQVFWESPVVTYRIYSFVSGVLYILLALPVADALGRDKLEKSTVLAFLLTAGYIQLFFGYVENYPLYIPGLLLYIIFGLRSQKDDMPLYVPALLLGMLFALHRAFLVFGPSLLVLAICAFRHRRGSVSHWKNAAATATALCCAPASAALFLGFSGVGFEAYLGGPGVDEFLPLFAEPGFNEQHRIFSLSHVLDFLNQQLLAAPSACMVLFLLRKKVLRHQSFLAVCTVVPLFFTFIANPKIGAFRDWDILALPALPFTLWASSRLMECIHSRGKLFHCAFLFCGTAALHTLLWIGLNANADATEARYKEHVERLTGNAGRSGWENLGVSYRLQNKTNLALEAYERALNASPKDPRLWMLVGNVYYDLGQIERGIDHLNKALEIRPDFAAAHNNLASAYVATGRYPPAIKHLKRALEIQPDLAVSYMNLGAIYRKSGQLHNAIESLEKAVALQPEQAQSHAHLGAAYRDAGQNDMAIQHLSKAIALQPDHLIAYVDVGFIYKGQGKFTLAIEHFKKALELQGGQANAMAYLNIGDTYHKMAQHEKAIPYFQKAIQLDPDHANAHLLLGLAYRALNRGEEARIHFEKTLGLAPNHPQAAHIRQWLERR